MPARKTNPKPSAKPKSLSAAWARRREDASHEIEKAALTYFAEHGVDGVTVDEIAEAANISRRTFYRYFQTVDDILTAQARRTLHHIAAAFRARPPEEPIYDSFLYAMQKVGESDLELEINRLTARVMKRSPEAPVRALRAMHMTDDLEIMITERLRANGEETTDASMIAALLMAIILQVIAEARLAKREPRAEDFVQARRALAKIVGPIKLTRRPPRG